MESGDGPDDATEPSIAELKAYIDELKRHINLLQAENRSLLAEVHELQRRLFFPTIPQP